MAIDCIQGNTASTYIFRVLVDAHDDNTRETYSIYGALYRLKALR